MNKKIKRYIITGAITIVLIIIASWLTQPTDECSLMVHQNIFEHEVYTDGNTSVDIPFEVMLTDFKRDTTCPAETDTAYTATLLLQPRGNDEPENIEIANLHRMETYKYMHYQVYIREYTFNPENGKLAVILGIERLRLYSLHAILFSL